MKVVSEILGHATTAITADLYTSVIDDLKKDAATKIAEQIGFDPDQAVGL